MVRLRPFAAAALSAALAGALPAASAGAAEPLADLLGQLAPAKAPQGSVEVVGWVERNAGGSELVVTFVPRGQVKLVADPGVLVRPLPREGVTWAVPETASRADAPGEAYFAEPPTLRVPFAGGDGQPVEAAVEYAYCLVDYQCLFGEAKVSALAPPPPSG